MKTLSKASTLLLLLAALPAQPQASAALSFDSSYLQHGDLIVIGNTLAQDVRSGVPAPTIGTVGAGGTNTADTAPDIYWQSDSPATGQAEASTSIANTSARTTALLTLPGGSTVTYARLYWSSSAAADTSVTLDRPSGFSSAITADLTFSSSALSTTGSANITSLVQSNGSGAYRFTGLSGPNLTNLNNSTTHASWFMSVVYELPSAPFRKITLMHGNELIVDGSPISATFSGLDYDPANNDASLTVIAFDGDNGSAGDSISVNSTTLFNDLNPVDNVFNSTRSADGLALSTAGDLPQLTGADGSMSGLDIDTFDISANLTDHATSLTFDAATTGDAYLLSFVGISVENYAIPEPEVASLGLLGATLLAATARRKRRQP